MRQYIGQIFLSAGLSLVFISFLFFARQAGTYMVLITLGLFVSLVFYLVILFGKKSRKTKIVWTFIVILAVILEYKTEPLLIKSSYWIYVTTNANELKAINNILIKHDGNIDISKDTVISESSTLTLSEVQQLKTLREKVDAYTIQKSNLDVYYGLYGFLDVRLGVTYALQSDPLIEHSFKHLTGNWYY